MVTIDLYGRKVDVEEQETYMPQPGEFVGGGCGTVTDSFYEIGVFDYLGRIQELTSEMPHEEFVATNKDLLKVLHTGIGIRKLALDFGRLEDTTREDDVVAKLERTATLVGRVITAVE